MPGPERGAGSLPAAVADTHALLFHAGGSAKLGRRASAHFAACEVQQALVFVPAAVIWEAAVLARSGRGNLRRSVQSFFEDLFTNPSYQPVDLTPAQIYDADSLRFGKDPFDALICAAARSLDLPLLTRDSVIRASGVVRVLW